MKKLLVLLPLLALVACDTDAKIASRNLSQAADQFEITRRVVFYDAIQGSFLLSVEGKCSIEKNVTKQQVAVTCKTAEKEYLKHFFGMSDNTAYFAEQLQAAEASAYHYRVVFKPQSILPDVDFKAKREGINK
jgi:hypothetical protein